MNRDQLLEEILKLPPAEQEQFLTELEMLEQSTQREEAQQDFMKYVHTMWPGFIDGRHHKVMAKKFQEIADGKCKRLIICMPPRHTKSEFGSYMLPSWFLGRFPDKKIIQCSNTAELAVGFGRKVRNLIDSQQYAKIFPGVHLRQDSKAAGRWAVNRTGEYFAIGVGGTVTGKGADLLIIDDPHSEQEAKLAVNNPEVFDSVYEWYTSGPRQRLQPGGAIVVIMCMTGDTPVLMADGTEKLLRDIRPGDIVGTFDNGKLKTAEVLNHQSNGVDSIYQIQTLSGKILRANERHPFLVMNEGEMEWTKLRDLRIGDGLVSLKDAIDPQKQKPNRDCAEPVRQERHTTEKTQTHQDIQLAITESGKGKVVRADSQSTAKACASSAIEINTRRQNEPQNKPAQHASNTGTASLLSNTIQWLKSVAISATYVGKSLLKKIRGRIGEESSASTTTMTPERYADFYATIATLRSGMEKRQRYLSELHRTSDFTVDPIVAINYVGEEEVFDVQIDRTENFIANGVVSHNTRWSKRDLVGRILKASAEKDGNDEWEIIEFPAILPSGNPLWPEFWSIEELEALKSELPIPKWNAQYQQQPTSEAGAIVKREWWRTWEGDRPPPCEFIIQSWDTAFTKNERSDYSACVTLGVFYKDEDPNDANIILLDAFKDRMEFPELKAKAFEYYKEWEPDAFIVEAKASGAPLIFELRRMGIPVQEFTPTRGNDKIVRINSVADLFASGKVWAPDRRWAEEVIEEMASFPYAEHDDMVDAMVQALIRFRKGGFIRLQTDEEDEPVYRRKVAYY